MNNIENNGLILTFMGIKPRLIFPDVYSYSDQPFYYNNGSLEDVWKGMCQYAKYDKDYNWLMTAVNKCLVICHNEMLNEWEVSFSDCFFSCSIDKMYNEVVSFIHWYNQQGKNA